MIKLQGVGRTKGGFQLDGHVYGMISMPFEENANFTLHVTVWIQFLRYITVKKPWKRSWLDGI